MLYDVLPDGRRVHALALLSSIYRLRDEAWAEHRYLFTADDAMERPAWAAALKVRALSRAGCQTLQW